ncbi:hypothetical protein JTB14_021122 [Gonioctena quinquepunctata]|nr:hypothetical protein JTB14_021122 [Gonioctena quinquepunctata]
MFGKPINVNIHGFNDNYELLNTFVENHNTNRLKVVIDKLDVSRNIVKSITPKRLEVIIGTYHGEGITPITSGICSSNIFFEEPSYIFSTVPSTSHSDVPSTSLVTIEPPPKLTHLSEEPFIFPSILIPSNATIEPPPLKPFVSNVPSTFSSEPSVIWSGPSVISSEPYTSTLSTEPSTSTLSSEPPPLIPFLLKVLCEPSTSTSNEPSTSTISSVSSKRTLGGMAISNHLKNRDESSRLDCCHNLCHQKQIMLHAPTCFVILKKESLQRHVTKSCKGMSTPSSKGMTYRSRAVSEGIHSDASDVMKNYVFPSFREGIIKECIRNRLIRMAKVLVQIKQTHPQVNQFRDILRREFFNTIIQVINNMGQLDDDSECIKSKDNVGKSDAEDLAQLLNSALPAHINETATESLLKQKITKKIQLPSTEDMRLLNNYLLKHCEIHFDKLSKKFDKQSWMELSGAVFLGLLIFNRRRTGELERALLTDLDMLVSMNKDKLINHNLNDEEQKRVGVYSRFVVRGKLARGVPVLLHDSYKTYLDLVLRHRKEAAQSPDHLESERQKVPENIDGPSSALTDSPAAGPSGLCKNTSYSGSSSEFNPSSEGESSDDDTASLATTPKHQPKRERDIHSVSLHSRLTPGLFSVKRTWSTPERSAARMIFASQLEEGINPTQKEIGVAVRDCKELKGRSIPQIKMWLQNQRLRKTKSMWNTPRRHSCKKLFRKFIQTDETSYPTPTEMLDVIKENEELASFTPRRIRSQIQQERRKYRNQKP